MPHRDLESEERPGKGARRQGEGDNWHGKDTTVHLGTAEYTPSGRKSPWIRLADALADPGAGPAVRELLEAGRQIDAEPGDGVAAFLPDGEVLLFLATADGLEVRRNVPADEVALFLADVRAAA